MYVHSDAKLKYIVTLENYLHFLLELVWYSVLLTVGLPSSLPVGSSVSFPYCLLCPVWMRWKYQSESFPGAHTRIWTQCQCPCTGSLPCIPTPNVTWLLVVPASECNTILRQWPGTNAQAPSVNKALKYPCKLNFTKNLETQETDRKY